MAASLDIKIRALLDDSQLTALDTNLKEPRTIKINSLTKIVLSLWTIGLLKLWILGCRAKQPYPLKRQAKL